MKKQDLAADGVTVFASGPPLDRGVEIADSDDLKGVSDVVGWYGTTRDVSRTRETRSAERSRVFQRSSHSDTPRVTLWFPRALSLARIASVATLGGVLKRATARRVRSSSHIRTHRCSEDSDSISDPLKTNASFHATLCKTTGASCARSHATPRRFSVWKVCTGGTL